MADGAFDFGDLTANAPAEGGGAGLPPAVRFSSPTPDPARVTGNFGEQRAARGGTPAHVHQGEDEALGMGTPLNAMADGTVVYAGPRSGYGNVVEIKHADGSTSRLAHLSSVQVQTGQTVKAGMPVALSGRSGNATGPSVHIEVIGPDGQRMDPAHVIEPTAPDPSAIEHEISLIPAQPGGTAPGPGPVESQATPVLTGPPGTNIAYDPDPASGQDANGPPPTPEEIEGSIYTRRPTHNDGSPYTNTELQAIHWGDKGTLSAPVAQGALGQVGTAIRHGESALTGGWSDKFAALGDTVMQNRYDAAGNPVNPDDFGGRFSRNLDRQMGITTQTGTTNPIAAGAGNVVGGVLQGALMPEMRAASLPGRVAVGALQGAGMGALDASGHARGDLGQIATQTWFPTLAGAVTGGAMGGVLGPVRPGGVGPNGPVLPAADALAPYTRTGIDPSLAVNGGASFGKVAMALKGLPVVGVPLSELAFKTSKGLDEGVLNLAGQYGASTNAQQAGSALQAGATAARDTLKANVDQVYAPLNRLEQSNITTPATSTVNLVSDIRSEYPNTGAWFASRTPLLGKLEDTLQNNGGVMTYGEMKRIRSDFGEIVARGGAGNDVSTTDLATAKRLYGSLSDDMSTAVGNTARETVLNSGGSLPQATIAEAAARTVLTRANGLNATLRDTLTDTILPILGARTDVAPEAAFEKLVSSAGWGSSRADLDALKAAKAALSQGPQASGRFNLTAPGTRSATIGNTKIDYFVGPSGVVDIGMIETPVGQRNAGSARAAMETLTRDADVAGTRLTLTPYPTDDTTTRAGVEAFYGSLGFKPQVGTRSMIREPTPATNAWNEVAAGTLARMGREGGDASGRFSPDKFLTQLGKLSPEGRSVLFGTGNEARTLSDLAQIARDQQRAEKFFNHSNSANAGGILGGIVGAGALAGQAAEGHYAPAVISALTGLGGYGMAHVLSNPGVARFFLDVSKAKPSAVDKMFTAAIARYPGYATELQAVRNRIPGMVTAPLVGAEVNALPPPAPSPVPQGVLQ